MSEKTELKPGDRVRAWIEGRPKVPATLLGVNEHSRCPFFVLLDDGGYGTYTHAEPIPEPWQPKEGEPVAAWDKAKTSIELVIGFSLGNFKVRPLASSLQYEYDYIARIPDNFDPRNPEHYKVSWWEACGTDIWRP